MTSRAAESNRDLLPLPQAPVSIERRRNNNNNNNNNDDDDDENNLSKVRAGYYEQLAILEIIQQLI